MSQYTFTLDADRDMVSIWLSTAERWGEKQADQYIDTLHEGCQRIIDGIAAHRPLPDFEGISFYHCNRHFIFFTGSAETTVILAVLHDRMDIPARLSERLKSDGGKS